jgi:S-adenosylmethionine synthetase
VDLTEILVNWKKIIVDTYGGKVGGGAFSGTQVK